MQAGAHDYLNKPVDSREFLGSLNKAFSLIERRRLGEGGDQGGLTKGIVISLFGAKGGIGKTTLATNLAVAFAQLRRDSVALMDIDTRFGDVAIVLDLQPEKNISDAIADIDEIDRTNIKSYLTPHSSGISVLAAPSRPSDWRQVQIDARRAHHPGAGGDARLRGAGHAGLLHGAGGYGAGYVGPGVTCDDAGRF